MTKEEAYSILENYVLRHGLPIKDAVIHSRMSFDIQQTVNQAWTFRGLLMIAYDLKDNKEDGKA